MSIKILFEDAPAFELHKIFFSTFAIIFNYVSVLVNLSFLYQIRTHMCRLYTQNFLKVDDRERVFFWTLNAKSLNSAKCKSYT